MLYIFDKNIKICNEEIYVGKFTNRGEQGYNINIQLKFINTDNSEEGYINLDMGFEKDNDINLFLNRQYKGIPFDDNDNQFISFEIFDTERFLDTEIESEVLIQLKNVKNNKVKAYFEINDKLIKIKYDGYLKIKYKKTNSF